MPIQVRTAGALKAVQAFKVRQLGVVRTAKTVKVMHAGALRIVANFAPFAVSISPPYASSSEATNANVPVFAGLVTCSPNGGVGPFSYQWSRVSGSTLNVTNPNSASTYFVQNVPPGFFYEAVYRCTVTDATGKSAFADVPVRIENQGE